jgi:hypothetical protein
MGDPFAQPNPLPYDRRVSPHGPCQGAEEIDGGVSDPLAGDAESAGVPPVTASRW